MTLMNYRMAARELSVGSDCVAYLVKQGYLLRVCERGTGSFLITEDSVLAELAREMIEMASPSRSNDEI